MTKDYLKIFQYFQTEYEMFNEVCSKHLNSEIIREMFKGNPKVFADLEQNTKEYNDLVLSKDYKKTEERLIAIYKTENCLRKIDSILSREIQLIKNVTESKSDTVPMSPIELNIKMTKIALERYLGKLETSRIKEVSHLIAQQYLDNKLENLSDEDLEIVEDVNDLIHSTYRAVQVRQGVQKALHSILNTIKDQSLLKLKVINFLENFYESFPVSSFSPEQMREDHFQIALQNTLNISKTNNIEGLAGDIQHIYNDYLEQ
jgi:sulfur relay (sulfurtransferase) DsrC/TusE family protein